MPTDSDFHITKAGANNPHWEEIQVRVQENSIEDGGKKQIPCILCQHSCSSSCTRLLESLGAIHTWEVTDNDVNLSISSKMAHWDSNQMERNPLELPGLGPLHQFQPWGSNCWKKQKTCYWSVPSFYYLNLFNRRSWNKFANSLPECSQTWHQCFTVCPQLQIPWTFILNSQEHTWSMQTCLCSSFLRYFLLHLFLPVKAATCPSYEDVTKSWHWDISNFQPGTPHMPLGHFLRHN